MCRQFNIKTARRRALKLHSRWARHALPHALLCHVNKPAGVTSRSAARRPLTCAGDAARDAHNAGVKVPARCIGFPLFSLGHHETCGTGSFSWRFGIFNANLVMAPGLGLGNGTAGQPQEEGFSVKIAQHAKRKEVGPNKDFLGRWGKGSGGRG